MKFQLSGLFFVWAVAGPTQAETSQENRLGRTIEVQWHVGFGGTGYSAGVYLPDDCRIDFKKSQGDMWFSGFDEKSLKAEFQSFTRNSLYYALGFQHRSLLWDQSTSSVTTYSDNFLERSSISSEEFYFVVGNEWTLGNFVIGGEWFGMSQSFHRRTDNVYKIIATDTDRKRSQRRLEERLRMPSFIQPSLVLGFSF